MHAALCALFTRQLTVREPRVLRMLGGAAQARQTRAQFSNWLCHEASGACKAKPPPLPPGRAPGPAFEVIDPKEAELEKMLAGMKARPDAG